MTDGHFEFLVDWTLPSPSFLDGIDASVETSQRVHGCQVVQAACVLLQVPQQTAATGQTLLQRFYCRSSLKRMDVRLLAMACIYLACKVEESERTWRDVVNVSHRVFLRFDGVPYEPLDRSSTQQRHGYNFWELKNELMLNEQLVLKELGFLLSVEHAHKFLLNYLNVLNGAPELAQRAWNVANDSLRSVAYVRYAAPSIAVACIYIAARQLGIALPETPTPWWRLFDVTTEQLDAIGGDIVQLYAAKTPAKYIKLCIE